MAVSPVATVVCGSRHLDWEDLAQATKAIEECGFSGYTGDGPRHAILLDAYRVRFHQHTEMTLLELLLSSQFCFAIDERDKVFALLGLATDISRLDIKPEYEKTHAFNTFFQEATVSMIRTYKPLDALGTPHVEEFTHPSPILGSRLDNRTQYFGSPELPRPPAPATTRLLTRKNAWKSPIVNLLSPDMLLIASPSLAQPSAANTTQIQVGKLKYFAPGRTLLAKFQTTQHLNTSLKHTGVPCLVIAIVMVKL